jgi:hypothetical protein
MDIISHGLWGSIAFGRRNRRSFWMSFFFGVVPDLFSFGIFTATIWLGFASGPDWGKGLPDPNTIPEYVHSLYDWTHSLLIFLFAFAVVWVVRKRPLWEMCGWGFHIIFDIFTHSSRFFPTPFLWPLSDVTFEGIPWGDARIFIPNIVLLAVLYVWYFIYRRRQYAKKSLTN